MKRHSSKPLFIFIENLSLIFPISFGVEKVDINIELVLLDIAFHL